MVRKILSKGKRIFVAPQTSVLSAASVIMLMIIASRVLGLVRQRTLAHFFSPENLSLFFAAFRLPDLIFEVLVFGTFSSAFIPVFTKSLKRGNSHAWDTAAIVVNIGLIIFIVLALVASVFADNIYSLFAPGFSDLQRVEIVKIAKILFFAQGFFVISYVLTGVLESLRRFLVPALAPLFYNLGIIFGTILLETKWGLVAPAIGVFIGAFLHFLVQVPLAMKLGFRFIAKIRPNKEVKKIGKLALPRVIELSFLQISKTVELFLSSLISTASYTYLTFGNTLQLLPVGLFGISIAKAALPTLSRQSNAPNRFRQTLLNSVSQIAFFTIPFAVFLIVLRIPLVRLIYGTQIFGWEATVQTGMVLSAFAISVVFQAINALLARAFYAPADTKTPVAASVATIMLVIALNLIFVKGYNIDVWGLALAFSIGSIFQTVVLFYFLKRRIIGSSYLYKMMGSLVKSTIAALFSGVVMYVLLKVFDRSVWVKRLSFLGRIESTKVIAFENFVLDTRYTFNLLLLTISVSLLGAFCYFGISYIFKNEQLASFLDLIRRVLIKRKITPIPKEEPEPVVPTPTDTTTI